MQWKGAAQDEPLLSYYKRYERVKRITALRTS